MVLIDLPRLTSLVFVIPTFFFALRPAAAVTVEARSAYGSPGEVVELRVHIRTMGVRVDGVEYDLGAMGIDLDPNDCNRGEAIPDGIHVERVRIGGFPDDTVLQTCNVELPGELGLFPLSLDNVSANGPGGTPLAVGVDAGVLGAVEETPTPTPTFTPGPEDPVCGNFNLEFGEECDDGNVIGADGCASNCTVERQWPFVFRSGICAGGNAAGAACDTDLDCPPDGTCSGLRAEASAQSAFLRIALGLHGTQTVRAGSARETDTFDKDGKLVARRGDVPVAFNLLDSQIDPIPIPPFACACVRFFGLGTVAARGVIACDDEGLDGIDYELVTNHDVSDTNPQCIGGLIEQPSDRHPGACNLIPAAPQFDGHGPRGSAVIETGLAIALYSDGGRCCQAGVDPDCDDPFMDKGEDGIPCNGDDFAIGDITRVYLTTGTARASIENADAEIGTRIAAGSQAPCLSSEECPQTDETCIDLDTTGECGMNSTTCECRVLCGTRPCVVDNTGQPFDCDAIAADIPDRFAGGVLVSASVLFDSLIGDNVITSTLVDQTTPGPTATPSETETSAGTPTPTETATEPTPTHTETPEPSETQTEGPTATETSTAADTSTPTMTPTDTATGTPTETPTDTSTPTSTSTPTQTPTDTAEISCPGDCNGDGQVTVDEIVTAVNIALGNAPLTQCPRADDDGDGQVTVDEIVRAVDAALNGCD
jgi:cysteine-rich repeat protein